MAAEAHPVLGQCRVLPADTANDPALSTAHNYAKNTQVKTLGTFRAEHQNTQMGVLH